MDKNLKSLISAEFTNVYADGTEMHKYCVNRVSDAVVLECGLIYTFEKPSIDKNFCFGYRLSNESTGEFDDANNMVSHVKNDGGSYFKAHNLQSFDEFASLLENTTEMFACLTYSSPAKFCDVYDSNSYQRYRNCLPKEYIVLTKNDIENLKKVNAIERAKFEKRLNTYLKKYGTSKLRSWSYWSEE